MNSEKGTEAFPYSVKKGDVYLIMAQKDPLTEVRSFVNQYIIKWSDVFLVDISVSLTNKIMVLLDADKGLNIDKCADVNRALYKFVQQEDIFKENNFSIEVSSPGVDRPLKLVRQYIKNIGRDVEVKRKNGDTLSGKLVDVEDDCVRIEEVIRSGRKIAEWKEHEISFEEVDQIKVLLTF